MSLIEKLGWYDEAKKISEKDHNIGLIRHFEYMRFTYLELKKALLEHRRQHNIFEVGDKVVLSSIAVIGVFNGISKTSSDHCFIKYGDDSVFALIKYTRHATDKEIAQGYRDE